jgi:hypothetical protein
MIPEVANPVIDRNAISFLVESFHALSKRDRYRYVIPSSSTCVPNELSN